VNWVLGGKQTQNKSQCKAYSGSGIVSDRLPEQPNTPVAKQLLEWDSPYILSLNVKLTEVPEAFLIDFQNNRIRL